MCDTYLQIAMPIIGLSINAIIQIIGFKYVTKGSMVKSVSAGYFTGIICIIYWEYHVGSSYAFNQEFLFIFITNIIIYTCLSYCYFGIIGLGLSLRIRILDILSKAPNGLPYEKIAENFDSKVLFERRILRLVQSGQIKEKEGRYHTVDSIFLKIARLNALVKKIMVGKTSEFDE